MPKFRKKPVEIEAIQFKGDVGAPEIVALDYASEHVEGIGDCLIIPTLEGDHRARPGDWIITGVAGERYPCKPEIFAATYDPVDD